MTKLLAVTFLPSRKGKSGNSSLFLTYDTLRKYFEVHLICLIEKKEIKDLEELKKLWPEVRFNAIVVEYTFKKRIKQALYSFINILRQRNEIKSGYDELLKRRGRIANIKFEKIPAAHVKFINDVIEKNKFDIAVIEFFQFIGYADLIPMNVRKIFIHHEIRYKILEQESGLLKEKIPFLDYSVKWLKDIELFYLNKYDYIFTMNDDDYFDLAKHIDTSKLIKTSAAPYISAISSESDFSYKNKLTFLGGSAHFPNVDAVEWFLSEIWEKVLAIFPQTKLNIIGKWEKQLIRRYSKHKNVLFLGYVEDLKSEIEGSIFILPIRIGSGFRTKLVEALMYKVPIVSTYIGKQGFNFSSEAMLISDEPKSFAENIMKLINDKILAKSILENLEAESKEYYDPFKVYDNRALTIKSLV